MSHPYFPSTGSVYAERLLTKPDSRGKKIYRKFDPVDYTEPEGGSAALTGLQMDQLASPRPFTRSSVKPRFLFGDNERASRRSKTGITASHNYNHQSMGDTSDEEAITDIEDTTHDLDGAEAEAEEPEVQTPTKPCFNGPATPPTTTRKRVAFHDPLIFDPGAATAGDSAEADNDARFRVRKAAKKPSPFDGWARTKSGRASSSSSSGVIEGSAAGKGKNKRLSQDDTSTAEEYQPRQSKRVKAMASPASAV